MNKCKKHLKDLSIEKSVKTLNEIAEEYFSKKMLFKKILLIII